VAHQLVIVGGGRIGSALVRGLLAAGTVIATELTIVEVDGARRAALSADLPVAVVGALEPGSAAGGGGAVLAVKPDQAEAAARTLGATGTPRVLTLVAGLSTARVEAVVPAATVVVRAMTNTPVLVGRGTSVIAGGSRATAGDLAWAEGILGAVGSVRRLPERHLDVVTALSGSMPAYLYLVVEALVEAGVHQGLSREDAAFLVTSAFGGSATLLELSGQSPEQLRADVTSPGGTTAAGLRILESRAVRAAFLEAVAAAAERSRQLGR
jgi:pyrroline-5-carboxylate reductase